MLLGEVLVFDALPQKLRGVFDDLEGAEVRRVVSDGFLVGEIGGGVLVFAAEKRIGIALDEFDRGGGEADLIGIKPAENIAIAIVNAAVRFIRDDQIKEAGVEVLKAFHHRRVGREVNALGAIPGCGTRNENAWFGG